MLPRPSPDRAAPRSTPAPGWAAALLLSLLLAGSAHAAEVRLLLQNGDRLSGRLVRDDTSQVILTNDLLGLLVIPRAAIRERQEPAPSPAPTPAGQDSAQQRRLEEARAAFVTGQLSVAEYHRRISPLLNPTPTLSRTGAPPDAVQLSGEIQAGFDLGLATKDRQLYTGRARLQHGWRRLRNHADYLFTYGRSDGELNANRMDGTIKTDYDLTDRVYAYNQANGGYDEVRKLANYWQTGPGAGWRALRTPHLALSLEAGVNFQEQNWTDGSTSDIFYYRVGQLARWAISQRLTLDQKTEFFPEWNTPADYKLRLEGNLRLWLYGNLSLNLTVIDFYDTMAAPGVEANDLQLRSTLGVTF